MGHIGITPQTIRGKYRYKGKTNLEKNDYSSPKRVGGDLEHLAKHLRYQTTPPHYKQAPRPHLPAAGWLWATPIAAYSARPCCGATGRIESHTMAAVAQARRR